MVVAQTLGWKAMLFAHVLGRGTFLVLPDNRVCFVAMRITSTLQGEDGCWPVQVSHNCAWLSARYHPVFGNITIDAEEEHFSGVN